MSLRRSAAYPYMYYTSTMCTPERFIDISTRSQSESACLIEWFESVCHVRPAAAVDEPARRPSDGMKWVGLVCSLLIFSLCLFVIRFKLMQRVHLPILTILYVDLEERRQINASWRVYLWEYENLRCMWEWVESAETYCTIRSMSEGAIEPCTHGSIAPSQTYCYKHKQATFL